MATIHALLHACVFGGGFYALPVATMLPVLLGPKIAAAPDGISLEEYSTSQSLFFVGWAFSAAFVVPCSDVVGRKPVLFGLVATALVAQVAALLTKATMTFQVLYFFVGFISSATGVSYIVCQESLEPTLRSTALCALNLGSGILTILLALGCEFLTQGVSWQAETLIYFTPYFFLLLCAPFTLQETLRKTSSAGSSDAVSPNSPLCITSGASGRAGSVLLGEACRTRLICSCICWMATASSFFGLSFAAGHFAPNIYKNMMLLASTDLVAACVAGVVVGYFGALNTQMASYGCAGAVLVCVGYMPEGSGFVLVGAMLGRLCLNVSFFTIYLLLVEHFPMEIRSTANGLVNFVARIAAAVAPMSTLLPTSISCTAMGGFCLLAAIATYKLPAGKDSE